MYFSVNRPKRTLEKEFLERWRSVSVLRSIGKLFQAETHWYVIEQVPYARVLFHGILRLLLEIDRRL